jgi:radical SAM superfamily enzyme
MLGLPPETEEMMFVTARELARLPVDGVKIHQLMVIRGTLLHDWFTKGTLECLGIERYAAILAGFLSRLRPDQHIHRIAAYARGETGLIAPPWSADKTATIHFLKGYLEKHGIRQGMLWRGNG